MWDRWQSPTSILLGKKKKKEKKIIGPHDYFRLCAHPIKTSFDRFALILLSWLFLKVSRYEILAKNWTLRDIDRRFRNVKQDTDHRSNSDYSSRIHDFLFILHSIECRRIIILRNKFFLLSKWIHWNFYFYNNILYFLS